MMQGDGHFPREVYRYIGARLKQVRTERGLTQAYIAGVIGVSPQQYQKYEDASSKCSLVHIYALAENYGISVDEFLPMKGDAATVPMAITSPTQNDLASDTDLVARLVSSFVAIPDRQLRASIVDVVEAAKNSAGRE
jgi:transcriptional regulator with XRE-family HTH domain